MRQSGAEGPSHGTTNGSPLSVAPHDAANVIVGWNCFFLFLGGVGGNCKHSHCDTHKWHFAGFENACGKTSS